MISFNNNEDNLKKVLTHPLAMVITDGLLLDGAGHPRTFGTYPKFLGEFVREKRWLPLGQALRKTSTLAARRFRLARRGTIEAGNWLEHRSFQCRQHRVRRRRRRARPPSGRHRACRSERSAGGARWPAHGRKSRGALTTSGVTECAMSAWQGISNLYMAAETFPTDPRKPIGAWPFRREPIQPVFRQ